jgi:hypothetical protein
MTGSPLWIPAARNLCLCAAFALLVWAPLGCRIVRRMTGEIAVTSLSISISIGLGAWGLWILALGLVGALYPAVVLISAAALWVAVCTRWRLRRPAPGVPHRTSATWIERLLIAILGLISLACIGVVLASALAPESSFDALNVHLPYARNAALAHTAGFAPNNWSSAMPALPLMTYITGFLFSGVTLAKLFNVLCYLLCGGVTYFFAARRLGRVHAVAAAVLFLSCPIALYEATTAMIDLPLTLFSAVAVLSFLEWATGSERGFLLLSGCGLGLALGCKYHSVFWVLPFFVILTWMVLRRRITMAESIRSAIDCLGVAGFIGLPWLVRAWVYTGNPVFPLANSIFKSSFFTPDMDRAAQAMYANEGVGRSLSALLRLPFTVTFHPGPFRGTLGIIFLVGIVMAIVRACRTGSTQQKRVLVLRYGLVCAACYFYAWALTAQEIRYLLPIVPLLSFLTSTGILGAENFGSFHGRFMTVAGVLLIAAGSVIGLPSIYPRVVREWTYWHSYQSPVPYLLGRQSFEEYLQRDVPSIYVYEYINGNLTGRDRILLLNDANQFYSVVPTLYSFTVEGELILLQNAETVVIEKLKQCGITHVLLNYNGLAPLPGVVPRLGAYFFLEKDFQERNLRPVYSRNNVTLFQIRTQ